MLFKTNNYVILISSYVKKQAIGQHVPHTQQTGSAQGVFLIRRRKRRQAKHHSPERSDGYVRDGLQAMGRK